MLVEVIVLVTTMLPVPRQQQPVLQLFSAVTSTGPQWFIAAVWLSSSRKEYSRREKTNGGHGEVIKHRFKQPSYSKSHCGCRNTVGGRRQMEGMGRWSNTASSNLLQQVPLWTAEVREVFRANWGMFYNSNSCKCNSRQWHQRWCVIAECGPAVLTFKAFQFQVR